MAANGQSDARGAAWLLALTARQCLSNPDAAQKDKTALNNAYRLLEAFRSNKMFAYERRSHSTNTEGAESLTMRLPTQSHLSEVDYAIRHSISSAFGSVEESYAIDRLEEVLRSAAYPEKYDAVERSLVDISVRFFQELEVSLQVA